MKKFYSILGSILIIAMLVTGCGGAKPAAQDKAPTAKRDNLNFAILAETKELDPHKSSDTLTYILLLQIFDTLIKAEPDGKLVPALAEKWEVSRMAKRSCLRSRKT